ncbi:hypothetical protein FACS1894159_02680 [Bacteroidia bacterium]|nr:hypothetical protein FACS1894159_02680 [Bacteroidia bacterium]
MTFLEELATTLYGRYGDEVSSLCIVLPTRRARLFLNDALASLAERPLWQPAYTSIDTLAERLSGLKTASRERLITELYKVYRNYHNESFDTFYHWGEMLLADFDQVDKYRVRADELFANIHDLREIDTQFADMNPEQRQIVERFWSAFAAGGGFASGSGSEESPTATASATPIAGRSQEKERFMEVWRTLAPIYHDYRRTLEAQGIAYAGMMHRRAAEKLIALKDAPDDAPEDVLGGVRYIVAGFNALSECEKALFDHLRDRCRAEFYWDYDSYYTDAAEQEAGLFLRSNIRRYPQSTEFETDNFAKHKEMVVVGAPSDSLQAKYAADFLHEATTDRKTAIVLTDENLLTPTLYSVSTVAEQINITMGYPLRQTLAYSFAERLLQLRATVRQRDGRTLFHHTEVVGILTHPFLRDHATEQTAGLVHQIIEGRLIYADAEALGVTPLLAMIFPASAPGPAGQPSATQTTASLSVENASVGPGDIAAYLVETLTAVARLPYDGDQGPLRTEYFATIIEAITRVANSLEGCGIELSDKVFASLLRRHLQSVRIPYEGEPLQGVQIMGILETRNLDFDNMLLLSVGDDTFPGNRMGAPSFIPYNLRAAYGLPDASHHEGVYAYYFYRLLQRARKVHIVYCSASDERRTGEESRYIYQLRYESGHTIGERRLRLEINHTRDNTIAVGKRGVVADELGRMLDGRRRLSPSALNGWVDCPLKFYFRSVAALSPADELTEQIEAPMLGTILHKAMELLYGDLVGAPRPQKRMAALIGSREVDDAVEQAIRSQYLNKFTLPREEYGGNLLLAGDIVCKYINSAILPFDARGESIIEGLEVELKAPFAFPTPEGMRSVTLYGKADRTERLPDGTLRIVDYKTGTPSAGFGGVEALFSPSFRERNGAALQTLLYALMATRMGNATVQPALYYVRNLSAEDYSPLLVDSSARTEVAEYGQVRVQLEAMLARSLGELFDFGSLFTQCNDRETCRMCDFANICRR